MVESLDPILFCRHSPHSRVVGLVEVAHVGDTLTEVRRHVAEHVNVHHGQVLDAVDAEGVGEVVGRRGRNAVRNHCLSEGFHVRVDITQSCRKYAEHRKCVLCRFDVFIEQTLR